MLSPLFPLSSSGRITSRNQNPGTHKIESWIPDPPTRRGTVGDDSLKWEGLNPEQLRAVTSIEGPVMVAAGPGTGKTQILAARIANILSSTDTPPDGVLALTFTESGARSMRERLLGLIGPTAYYVNIATFHSFCSDIIQSNPDHFVMQEEMEPLGDLQRIQIFREIIDASELQLLKPLTNRYFYVSAIIKSIQDLKREGVSPIDFKGLLPLGQTGLNKEQLKNLQKQQDLLLIYQTYQKTLATKGLYDFEDMISFVAEAFRLDADFLRKYQERFLYILADEFQDTNNAQSEVLNLLASFWDEPNIFVVGDANQSIYRFQGASTENMVGFAKRYKSCQKITLTKNYRSTQLILDAATELISNNELRLSKIFPEIPERLTSKSDVDAPEPKIALGEFSSGLTESFFVAQSIKNLIDQGVNPKEIAVIYRHNRDSALISDALAKMGIAYNLEGGQNVLNDYDIQKFMILLEAILAARNGSEDVPLFTIFNFDFLHFDPLDVLKLSRFASRHNINFVEALGHIDVGQTSGITNLAPFKEFLEKLVAWGKLDAEKTFVEFFERVLTESTFMDWILGLPNAYEKLNKLNSLFAEVKKLNFANRRLGLAEFLENLKTMQESGLTIEETDLDVDTNAVRLTTAHRAKGQEYEHVFITNCIDKKWGNNVTREMIKLPEGIIKNTDLNKKEKNEDERRLFYVAATRAKKQITVTYARSYGDGARATLPSMFLSEISDDKKEWLDTSQFESKTQELVKQLLTPLPAVTDLDEEEQAFLTEIIKDFKLSVTALNTYLECAYKFKLNNILRTPRAKTASLSLGTAVHVALEKFFTEFINTSKLPALEFLVEHFREAATKELLSEKDLKEVLKKGERVLRSYYAENKARFVKPLYTEKNFGYGWKVLLGDVSLVGKVDRVDLIDQKEKLVRVVDYKTGAPQTRGQIEGTTADSDGGYKRQLVFYKLLADLDKTFEYKVTETELDFVGDKNGDSKREVFTISDGETEELKKTILSSMTRIRGLDFGRTTDYRHCTFCDYRKHCWPEGIPLRSEISDPLVGDRKP